MKNVRALWQGIAREREVSKTVQFKGHATTIRRGAAKAKREGVKTPSLLDICDRLSRQAHIDFVNGQCK